MRSRAALIGFAALVVAGIVSPLPATAQDNARDLRPGQSPKKAVNTLVDIYEAIHGCWQYPPIDEVQSGMDVTIFLSFKRNGEIFGARLTYQTKNVSPRERDLYYRALADMMRRCSPLPFTDGLGNAVAGRPLPFHFPDNRKLKKV
jgi:hypothetical protein